MVIVAGTIELDPDQREAFLAGRIDGMRTSRAEPGCLEYTPSADPTDLRRVVFFERWASQEALDAHLAALRARPAAPGTANAPKATSIFVYDVTRERQFGGESRRRTDHRKRIVSWRAPKLARHMIMRYGNRVNSTRFI